MIAEFFEGQVRQLLKRYQLLHSHLQYLYNISQVIELPDECKDHANYFIALLKEMQGDIEGLLEDPNLGNEHLQQNQLGEFRYLSDELALIEWYVLSVLDHYNDNDHYLYRFIEHLCQQIHFFPDPQPLLCAHGTGYFYTYSNLLICCPLFEDHFLLAAPCLVHELGHIFYNNQPEGIFEPFFDTIKRYLELQQRRLTGISVLLNPRRLRQNRETKQKFERWEKAWEDRFIYEFACDIFAAYIVGPACAWSLLRTIYAIRSKLYRPGFGERGTHPSLEARMRGILFALRVLEDANPLQTSTPSQADTLARHWKEHETTLSNINSEWSKYDYMLCYPDELLQPLAAFVIDVYRNANFVPYYEQPVAADNLPAIMHDAWLHFHADPKAYNEWETEQVDMLKNLFSKKQEP